MIYVTEDKFDEFDLLKSIQKDILKVARDNGIFIASKNKHGRWYRFIYELFYIKEIDYKDFFTFNIGFNNNKKIKFVTNKQFIDLLQGGELVKPDVKNLELVGLSNRFYKGDPELLYFLNRLETLGIYIDKNDIKYKNFKFIFFPKKNLLTIEQNGRYEECGMWQYYTTNDFLEILENHIINIRNKNIFEGIKIKQYKY